MGQHPINPNALRLGCHLSSHACEGRWENAFHNILYIIMTQHLQIYSPYLYENAVLQYNVTTKSTITQQAADPYQPFSAGKAWRQSYFIASTTRQNKVKTENSHAYTKDHMYSNKSCHWTALLFS